MWIGVDDHAPHIDSINILVYEVDMSNSMIMIGVVALAYTFKS